MYEIETLNRPTTASPFNETTIIKYMAPRSLGINFSNSFQGSLRSFALPKVDTKLATSAIKTSYGLLAMVDSSGSSSSAPLHEIDSELINDDNRKASKLNETLADKIVLFYERDVCNRAQESQLRLLQANADKSASMIQKMFQTEIETGRQLIEDASRHKSDLNKKLDNIHQVTVANDQHYHKLLSKRNSTDKDIFEYQRQLAQDRAESEFIRWRIQQFNDEINFYTLKNNVLQGRVAKLRYELDEEIFAKDVLRMEIEVLQNEKTTNEDIHLSSLQDIRQTIKTTHLALVEPSNKFREQLNLELRRMQSEYAKKLQTYKDELHRKFEIEYHRYRMHKKIPLPIKKEHEENIEHFKREKNDTDQRIRIVSELCNQLKSKIQTIEQRIIDENIDKESSTKSQRHLAMLQQIIRERQKQLDDANKVRANLKKTIEDYETAVQQYSSQPTDTTNTVGPSKIYTTTEQIQLKNDRASSRIIQLDPPSLLPKVSPTEETALEEKALLPSNDFDVEQDCRELHSNLQKSSFDEVGVITLLCRRTVAQRQQIREKYKNLYNESLSDIFEAEIHDNAKTILKILLLSPVQFDCFELRRTLQERKFDENIFVEIFLTRSNQQIKNIIGNYSKIFKSSLEKDIIGDEETPSKRIILALLQANRPENDHIDREQILNDAKHLYEMNAKWRKDGSTFTEILCNRSNENIKQIFAAYEKFSRLDIEDSIQIDKDLELSRTLMSIVRIIRNRARFYAFELRKAFKITGSNQENLTRIIVSRCEIDMVQIKSEFEIICKRTLFDHIQSDTSGNFKRALLELLSRRLDTNTSDLSFKRQLESSLATRKPRLTVQWKEPISQKTFRRSISDQDIPTTTLFDRNNQAKTNTLLRLNSRPALLSFLEARPKGNRSYSATDYDE